jgi:hypothetical protein
MNYQILSFIVNLIKPITNLIRGYDQYEQVTNLVSYNCLFGIWDP